MMDLILWRHAEAQEYLPGGDDLARALTRRGEADAARMGAWLDRRLPESIGIFCSPALRCEQTALALGRKYVVKPELGPNTPPQALLQAVQWPHTRQAVLLVGHQPTLGQLVAQLLGMQAGTCPVRKGAAWWLRVREREGAHQTVLVAVQSPELA